MVLPNHLNVCPHSVGLIAGIFWSKSPLFPGIGGALVTNDWCISFREFLLVTDVHVF